MVHVVLCHDIHNAGILKDVDGTFYPEVIGLDDVLNALIDKTLGCGADTLGIGAAVLNHQLQLIFCSADVDAALIVVILAQGFHLNLVVVVDGGEPSGGVDECADFQNVVAG